VNTVAQSESGYEKTVQAISIMAHQELILEPGEEWQQGITWQVETAALLSQISEDQKGASIAHQVQ
jgi:hypothetical protein